MLSFYLIIDTPKEPDKKGINWVHRDPREARVYTLMI